MAYLGKTPSQAVRQRYLYTASGSETSISGADDNGNTLSYTDGGYVDVYLNGVLLVAGTDYNTSTTNTIGGLSALSASDVVEIVVYDVFSVFGGDVQGNLTISNGTLTSGAVDINGGTIDGTTIGGSTPAAGTFTTLTASGDVNFDSNTLFVDASENKVGIGTSSPNGTITVRNQNSTEQIILGNSINTGGRDWRLGRDNVSTGDFIIKYSDNSNDNNTTEAMRIDSSGHLYIGSTTLPANSTTTGIGLRGVGDGFFNRSGAPAFVANRITNGGVIAKFQKDGTDCGWIGENGGDLFIGTGSYNLRFADGSADVRPFNANTGSDRNGDMDLGGSGARYRTLYATDGTINVSDVNEKQDIEELSEAEQRVAVACKGLLRKFRWKDMVAEKGDDARIHFGIIAQDLQAAFEAEGLDAGRYSMFVKETYYELLTDVPAVQAQDAVLDDEGNIISEAVEAKEAYTSRTVYKAHEEIPEGAEPVTTYGVRYSELLAFIIAAI